MATHWVDEKHVNRPKVVTPRAICRLLVLQFAVPWHYCSFYSCSYSFYRIYRVYRISGFYRFGSKFGQIVEY